MDAQDLQNLTEEELLDLFVDGLAQAKGVELTPELKEELLGKIKGRIDQMTVAALPEQELMKLNILLESGEATEEEVAKLIEQSGVDLEKITEQALLAVRAEYVDGKEVA